MCFQADDLLQMQNPDSLLPTDFGNAKKKRAARIIDDDEVSLRFRKYFEYSVPKMIFFNQ